MTDGMDKNFPELARRVAVCRDQGAFTTLFDHFAPRLKAYLVRIGVNPLQAEELVQEVMIVLWHRAELFDASRSSLSTWLFRIARNRRIDALRRDKSRSADLDDPMIIPEEIESAHSALEAEDRDAQVRAAMTDLPAEQYNLLSRQIAQRNRRGNRPAARHREVAHQAGLHTHAFQPHRLGRGGSVITKFGKKVRVYRA